MSTVPVEPNEDDTDNDHGTLERDMDLSGLYVIRLL